MDDRDNVGETALSHAMKRKENHVTTLLKCRGAKEGNKRKRNRKG